jgi:osmotically-inducible protein OsmY
MKQHVLRIVVGVMLLGSGGLAVVANAAPTLAQHLRPDQWLGWKVDTAFRYDRYLDYRDVRAHADHGVVVLTGTVLTDFEKAHAARVAGGVPGVTAVKNQILVVRDPAGPGSDLARRVRETLLQDPTLKVAALAIETEATDTIILHGIVNSAELKARIGQVASTVPGVKQVINDLDVESAAG